MQVRMVGDRLVAPNGFQVETWRDGSVHEVSADHGRCLIRDGWAVPAEGPSETKVVGPSETKDEPVAAPVRAKRKRG